MKRLQTHHQGFHLVQLRCRKSLGNDNDMNVLVVLSAKGKKASLQLNEALRVMHPNNGVDATSDYREPGRVTTGAERT